MFDIFIVGDIVYDIYLGEIVKIIELLDKNTIYEVERVSDNKKYYVRSDVLVSFGQLQRAYHQIMTYQELNSKIVKKE